MKINFNDCLTRLLKDEGGYTNDPSDSGGATNYGITIADYRAYINKNGTPNDVKNMKIEDAKRIYKTKYWDALGCDDLSSGVDYTVFDYGVNSGLQRPRNAMKKFSDKVGVDLINAINDERMAFLNNLAVRRPKDQKFLKGWTNRVARVRAYSVQLAKEPVHTPDNVSGPAAGAVAGVGATVGFWDQIMAHPYISTAIILGVVGSIWAIVHMIRNNNGVA